MLQGKRGIESDITNFLFFFLLQAILVQEARLLNDALTEGGSFNGFVVLLPLYFPLLTDDWLTSYRSILMEQRKVDWSTCCRPKKQRRMRWMGWHDVLLAELTILKLQHAERQMDTSLQNSTLNNISEAEERISKMELIIQSLNSTVSSLQVEVRHKIWQCALVSLITLSMAWVHENC